MHSLATALRQPKRLAERRCENLLVEARINAQNIDASGEFRKQTTKGGKVENRTRLFSDSFASHLLTYGGNTIVRSNTLAARPLASRTRKSTSAPAGCRMRSPCATCR